MARSTTLYRYLTGKDDAAFCHRVTEALSQGWALYGHPTLAYDASQQQIMCGQAITKDVEGLAYGPSLDLSKQ
jgi:hypothetical protein